LPEGLYLFILALYIKQKGCQKELLIGFNCIILNSWLFSVSKFNYIAVQDRSKAAYRFKRLNFFLHRPMSGGGWQDWNNVHLARRDVLRFGGMYHEDHIVDVPAERVGQLQSKMWHLNDSTYLERMGKSYRYCQEIAQRIKSRGRKIHWYDLFLAPLKEFVSKLIVKKGYRDKTIGLLWALHTSCAMFRACALVWDEQNRQDRSVVEEEVREKWRQSVTTQVQSSKVHGSRFTRRFCEGLESPARNASQREAGGDED